MLLFFSSNCICKISKDKPNSFDTTEDTESRSDSVWLTQNDSESRSQPPANSAFYPLFVSPACDEPSYFTCQQ